MQQYILAITILALAIIFFSCCGSSTSKVTLNGITYEIEDAPAAITIVNDAVRCDTPHGVLTVTDGEIVLAGKRYGLLERGDRLTLRADGTLMINGQVQDWNTGEASTDG